jgi:hypothetical protein
MYINGAKIDKGTDMSQDNLVKLLKSLIWTNLYTNR